MTAGEGLDSSLQIGIGDAISGTARQRDFGMVAGLGLVHQSPGQELRQVAARRVLVQAGRSRRDKAGVLAGGGFQLGQADIGGDPHVPVRHPVAAPPGIGEPGLRGAQVTCVQRQQPERPGGHPFPAGIAQLAGQHERMFGLLAGLVPAVGLGQRLRIQHLGPWQERIPPLAAGHRHALRGGLLGRLQMPGEQQRPGQDP
jgi:hypothetical protein